MLPTTTTSFTARAVLLLLTLLTALPVVTIARRCEQVEFFPDLQPADDASSLLPLDTLYDVTGYEDCADACCDNDACNVLSVSASPDDAAAIAYTCALFQWTAETELGTELVPAASNDTDLVTALLQTAEPDSESGDSKSKSKKSKKSKQRKDNSLDLSSASTERQTSSADATGDDSSSLSASDEEHSTSSSAQPAEATTTDAATTETVTSYSTEGTVATETWDDEQSSGTEEEDFTTYSTPAEDTAATESWWYSNDAPVDFEEADATSLSPGENAQVVRGGVADTINSSTAASNDTGDNVQVWYSGPEQLLSDLRHENDAFSLFCMFVTGLGLCVAGVLIIVFAAHMKDRRHAYTPLQP